MTPHDIKKEMRAALLALSVDPSLGYLAITSKPELPIRDRVAWYFHWKHPSLIAAREYWVKSERNSNRGKRVDLALLELNDAALRPVVLVEFKAMIVPDPLSNSEHKSMVSLANDLNGLANISGAPRLGVMLMVCIENVEPLTKQGLNGRVVKYLPKFRAGAKKPDALKKAIEDTSDFFDRVEFNVSPLTIELGLVWGAEVKLISFILERR
jgi:hypothetical protein